MSQDKLNGAGRKPPRHFSPAKRRGIVNWASANGVKAAAHKFKVHESSIYLWMNKAKHPQQTAVGKETYILARKLRAEVQQKLKTQGELDDMTIYAHLLTKAVLGQ